MHCVTLKMDRVFDIQPYPIGHQKRTCFSFESGGKRYLSVLVLGSPKLAAGQTISAVLREEGNWQSLIGLRVHETGEILAASPMDCVVSIVQVSVVAFVLWLQFAQGAVFIPGLLGYLVIVAALLHSGLVLLRTRRALRNALSVRPSNHVICNDQDISRQSSASR